MPPCRLTQNTIEFPENGGWSDLVKPLSCPTLLTRNAVAIAEPRTYRHVDSQKIDQRLTGNVIQKSINSVNYRLIESRFTSLMNTRFSTRSINQTTLLTRRVVRLKMASSLNASGKQISFYEELFRSLIHTASNLCQIHIYCQSNADHSQLL